VSHLEAIEARLAGAAVGAVLVTHSHPDHLPLADRLAERHHARVARWPELSDGDLVSVGKVRVTALHTPGHSADHLVFWIDEDAVAFTGDLVLGQGSSMITYPEGDMSAYLDSLDRLAGLRPRILFPAHRDPAEDPVAKIDEYKRHRLDREAQVLDELGRRSGTAEDLTERVYREVVGDSQLRVAAEMTLRAHLEKLVRENRARLSGDVYELG